MQRYAQLLISCIAVLVSTACSKKNTIKSSDEAIQITAFFPIAGSVDTLVTISGNNFTTDKSAITVMFGKTPATDIVSVSSTEIKVKVPKETLPGKVKITVAINGKTAISSGDFAVEPYVWKKLFGGDGQESVTTTLRTTDGSFVTVGHTYTNQSGDVGANKGATDAWVIKTDANGNKIWSKTYGGSGYDFATAITGSTDGNLLVVGYTNSNNSGDVGATHGHYDMWVFKLDGRGNLLWQKTFGGEEVDYAKTVAVCADGGFVAVGTTYSHNSGDVGANHGDCDFWVVRLDDNGNLRWQKTFGGRFTDFPSAITSNTDGSFTVLGNTDSNNSGDVGESHGDRDIWLISLDVNGNLQWQKTLGGSNVDQSTAIAKSSNGYFVAGYTKSNNTGDVGINRGERDMWVAKLDAKGNLLWQKLFGGSNNDWANAMTTCIDGSVVVAGGTESSNSGDVGANNGSTDMWLVKISATGALAGQQILGGSSVEEAVAVTDYASGAGYIVTGSTQSNNTGDVGNNYGTTDLWLVKTKEL